VAKTCLKTISIYLNNVLKDPKEEKYRRINLNNETFQKRVGKIAGGLTILKGVGFDEQHDGTLFLREVDEKLIKETVRLIENNL